MKDSVNRRIENPIDEFLTRSGEEIILFPRRLQIDNYIWAVGYLKQMGTVACASKENGEPVALLDHFAKFNPYLEIDPEVDRQIVEWIKARVNE
jgi:hypothetical protein